MASSTRRTRREAQLAPAAAAGDVPISANADRDDDWERDGELIIRPIAFRDHLPPPPQLDPRVPGFPALVAAVARPGEGKSTAVIGMLMSPQIWRGLYHRIYLFSPTVHSAANSWRALNLAPERVFSSYSDARLESVVAECAENDRQRCLIIFDDLQGNPALYRADGSSAAMRLAMNHRHFGGGVTLMFIVQSYTALPAKLRPKITDWLFFGDLPTEETKRIASEITNQPHTIFSSMLSRALDRPHSFLYVHRERDGRIVFRKRFGDVLKTSAQMLGE